MDNVLRAKPDDSIEDSGPKHQAGCLTMLAVIFCALLSWVVLTSAREAEEKVVQIAFYIVGTLLALPAVVSIGLFFRNAVKMPRPSGVDVLREVLQFTIPPNVSDVGATAFFRPGELYPGFATTFILAMQNYASRRRIVEVKFPTVACLSDLSGQTMLFELEPGQAAIYRHPIIVPRETPAKHYFVSLRKKIKSPTGTGSRLISLSKKEFRLTFTRPKNLAVILDVMQPAQYTEAPATSLAAPQYISLYSPALPEPRYPLLEALTHSSPANTIRMDS